MSSRWVVVVPVKKLPLAKSRLVHLPATARGNLALAAARDVVAAARGCSVVEAVYVVTNDLRAAEQLTDDGARVIADAADSGLNPALADGARIAAGWHPRSSIAALSADLPALTSTELAAALTAADEVARGFAADELGTGTTLLTAVAGTTLDPRFGPSSRDRHLQSGAVELVGDWPGLRCDVDTPADLDRAVLAGSLGAHTAAALGGQGSAG